jgi:hypothetical protein
MAGAPRPDALWHTPYHRAIPEAMGTVTTDHVPDAMASLSSFLMDR